MIIYSLNWQLLGHMQILLYLSTVWSVDIRCAVRFTRTRNLEGATHVKVVPHAFTGTRDIVPLQKKLVVSRLGIPQCFSGKILWRLDCASRAAHAASLDGWTEFEYLV
jgi:hypothetical protein